MNSSPLNTKERQIMYIFEYIEGSKFEGSDGLKRVDDVYESFFLAKLLRLGILPEGYIYPEEERPVRELLLVLQVCEEYTHL